MKDIPRAQSKKYMSRARLSFIHFIFLSGTSHIFFELLMSFHDLQDYQLPFLSGSVRRPLFFLSFSRRKLPRIETDADEGHAMSGQEKNKESLCPPFLFSFFVLAGLSLSLFYFLLAR